MPDAIAWWTAVLPSGPAEHVRPPAPRFVGHRSRLVQICIDSPPTSHDRGGVLAGRDRLAVARRRPRQFAGKLRPPTGSSVTPLPAARSDDRGPPYEPLDLGADDVEVESARLVELGAARLGPGRGWIVLRDPVGMVFCVTDNSPDNRAPP